MGRSITRTAPVPIARDRSTSGDSSCISPRSGLVLPPIGIINDAALATSANTMSVVRFARSVRGHVINPATGWPAHALVQATVVARMAVAADALSTGMLVSGREPPGALQVITVARAAPAPAPARGRAPAGPPSTS